MSCMMSFYYFRRNQQFALSHFMFLSCSSIICNAVHHARESNCYVGKTTKEDLETTMPTIALFPDPFSLSKYHCCIEAENQYIRGREHYCLLSSFHNHTLRPIKQDINLSVPPNTTATPQIYKIHLPFQSTKIQPTR